MPDLEERRLIRQDYQHAAPDENGDAAIAASGTDSFSPDVLSGEGENFPETEALLVRHAKSDE